METAQYSIYAIICPDKKVPRYVGCTLLEDVRKRVHQQYSDSNQNTELKNWLKSLKKLPIVVVLEKTTDRSVAFKIENDWIARLNKNNRLLNRIRPKKSHPVLEVDVHDLCGKVSDVDSINKILTEKPKS